jgi:sulfatase maturation enzyme AslB (radical SAM superfamily)
VTANVMAVVDTVLLKVASRCNLNCTYCYVYNMGDDGWRSQPKRMSEAVQAAVVDRLGDLARRQGRPFSVVLHGGEPLLMGALRLERLLTNLRAVLPAECGLHLQTNGVLLDDTVLEICASHSVGISIKGTLLRPPGSRRSKNRPTGHLRVFQKHQRTERRLLVPGWKSRSSAVR